MRYGQLSYIYTRKLMLHSLLPATLNYLIIWVICFSCRALHMLTTLAHRSRCSSVPILLPTDRPRSLYNHQAKESDAIYYIETYVTEQYNMS